MAGAASGVLNTVRQVGLVIGTAAVGALLQNRLVIVDDQPGRGRAAGAAAAGARPVRDRDPAPRPERHPGRRRQNGGISRPGRAARPRWWPRCAGIGHDVFTFGLRERHALDHAAARHPAGPGRGQLPAAQGATAPAGQGPTPRRRRGRPGQMRRRPSARPARRGSAGRLEISGATVVGDGPRALRARTGSGPRTPARRSESQQASGSNRAKNGLPDQLRDRGPGSCAGRRPSARHLGRRRPRRPCPAWPTWTGPRTVRHRPETPCVGVAEDLVGAAPAAPRSSPAGRCPAPRTCSTAPCPSGPASATWTARSRGSSLIDLISGAWVRITAPVAEIRRTASATRRLELAGVREVRHEREGPARGDHLLEQPQRRRRRPGR